MAKIRLSLAMAAGLVLSILVLTSCQRAADVAVASTPPVAPSAAPSAEVEKAADTPAPAVAAPTPPASSPVDSPSTSPTGEAAHRFEIRDQEGKPILTDRQIVAYDWKTHRITLEPGTKVEPREREGQFLVVGVPFAIAADGVVCYAGVFTTSLSSISQSVPVINVVPLEKEDGIVQIELGYPTEKFFRGVDPRGDQRIRTALADLGKLKE